VNSLLKHYQGQTDDEAVAEDEAAYRKRGQTVIVVPKGLVPAITRLITREWTLALRNRPNKGLPFPFRAQRKRLFQNLFLARVGSSPDLLRSRKHD
jgi:hypothetical protein